MLGLTSPQGEVSRAQVEGLVARVALVMETLTVTKDWRGGVHLLREVQVIALVLAHCPNELHDTFVTYCQPALALSKMYVYQASLTCTLPPPTLEYFHCTIAVWRALWLLFGNKKLSKLF